MPRQRVLYHLRKLEAQRLVEAHTERSGAILGAPPRVNVLLLNLALDERFPAR